MPAENNAEQGKLIGVAKRDTKIRSDFEIQGPMRDWITVIRPLQHIVRDHAEIMVDQGVMTDAESVRWINLHWELIVGESDGISGGGAIIAYGRERRTKVFVDVRRESNTGYERVRMKAWTYILARSGAGEDELDLDDLSVAGFSLRRATPMSNLDIATPHAHSTPATIDDDEFPFGFMDFDDDGPGDEGIDPEDAWVRVAYDAEAFQDFLEGRAELGKGEKSEVHARLEKLMARAKQRRAEQEAGEEEGESEGDGDLCGGDDGLTPGQRALRDRQIEERGKKMSFAAEGTDDESSPYFSRKPSVPSKESGLTVGRGYDMKHRTPAQVKADLIKAGVAAADAEKIAKGAGKSGKDAEAVIAEEGLGSFKLTTDQQKKLFETSYGEASKDAKRLYTKNRSPTDPAWDDLNPAMRATMTDLRYVGHNTPASRAKLTPHLKNNDLPGFSKAMSDESFWVKSPPSGLGKTAKDRFQQRAKYLKGAIECGE